MKGGAGGSSYNLPAKRRWRGLAFAVLGLVILSMLVPLVFLLGLHNGFRSYPVNIQEKHSSDFDGLTVYDPHNGTGTETSIKLMESERNHAGKYKNETLALPLPPDSRKPNLRANNTRSGGNVGNAYNVKDNRDSKSLCELKFGCYCLWRKEHRENMKDSMLKKMKDLLYVARAYYPSIAKLPALDKFSHELKQNIQEFERVLSEATADKDLPLQIEKKMDKMGSAVSRSMSYHVDYNNVDKKFRQLVDLTEDEANFHMKQSAFLFQLAVQTMPKSLHCLSMRLTVEFFRSAPTDMDSSLTEKFQNPELHHYVVFSNNILASSAVINSTVMNAKETSSQVFHVLTDRENYFAMKLWFFLNKYKEATVQVLDIENLELNGHYDVAKFRWLLHQEFHVSFRRTDKLSTAWIQTEYVSVFSHAHHLLPTIFPTLRKVVTLDDDIIVQTDLSPLWSINMGGKVNGATLLCTVRLFQLKNYLGEDIFDKDSCAWMSGLNIIDLDRWREHDLTKTYQKIVNEQLREGEITEAVVLRATLLTFQNHVYALDESWVLQGLGYNYRLDDEDIKKAAVLHFNGKMKPWLELGIPRYRGFWRKFLNPESSFLSDCNVNH